MFKREKKKVSIIIPSWFENSQHGKYGEHETFWFAKECLKRLLKVTPKELYELIIIDNGSSLDRVGNSGRLDEEVRDYFENADILITNKENLGFAPACNQGFDIARGEYIVCLNNDILVWQGWLETMIEDFENKDNFKNGPCGVLMPALEKTTGDAREALKLEKPDLSCNKGKFGAEAEFGSLWMSKKDILNDIEYLNDAEIGMMTVFDEKFKRGFGEDRKLWRQIRMIGCQTYRTHNTRVFHQGNMSMGKVRKIEGYKKDIEVNRKYLADWKAKHKIK